jgi:hypothetical protein
MNATNAALDTLFDGGPPLKIEHLLHVVKPDDPGIVRRVAIVAGVAWFPLLALSAVQEIVRRNGSLLAFALDFGAHARFLVAAPLFILAESWCLPLLGRITRHFLDSGMVQEGDCEDFVALVNGTRRALNSTWAEILTVVCAYAATAALQISAHNRELPFWSVQPENHGLVLSAAGQWHLWISLPLLFVLFFGWMWRQALWCHLLWRIARFDLKLVAAHPDQTGGLQFMETALRCFHPISFGLAAIVAGALANQIRDGAKIYDLRFFIVGLVVFVLMFFVAPFIAFVPPLRVLKRRGMLEYGALSCAVGHQFERKWIKAAGNVNAEALEAPDFSATTDLYQIVSNVYQIRYLPLSTRAVAELAVVTLIPFVPLVLMSVPLQVLLKGLKQILM